jgi:hypothetical protein
VASTLKRRLLDSQGLGTPQAGAATPLPRACGAGGHRVGSVGENSGTEGDSVSGLSRSASGEADRRSGMDEQRGRSGTGKTRPRSALVGVPLLLDAHPGSLDLGSLERSQMGGSNYGGRAPSWGNHAGPDVWLREQDDGLSNPGSPQEVEATPVAIRREVSGAAAGLADRQLGRHGALLFGGRRGVQPRECFQWRAGSDRLCPLRAARSPWTGATCGCPAGEPYRPQGSCGSSDAPACWCTGPGPSAAAA